MRKFVIIAIAMSTFVSMGVAFAQTPPAKPWTLDGDYAMMASGGCFHSKKGFTETGATGGLWIPNADADNVTWAAVTAATAFWTFEPDGTGTVWSGKNYVIDFSPGNLSAPTFGYGAAGSVDRMNDFGFTFTYTVTPYGDITVTPGNPALPVLNGTISQDKKTITLSSMNKLGGSPKGPAVCSATRILTKAADLPTPTP